MTSDEDDWFERAIADDEPEENAHDAGRDESADASDDAVDADDRAESHDDGPADEELEFDERGPSADDDAPVDSTTATDTPAGTDADPATEPEREAEPAPELEQKAESDSESGSKSEFEPESESEPEQEPPSETKPTQKSRSTTASDPESDAHSAGSNDSSGSLFADDFGAAMESAPDLPGGPAAGDSGLDTATGTAGDGFAGAGDDLEFGSAEPAFAASEEPTFDDAEIDSDLPRIDLGIEGLDGMIQGGVPERTLMVTIGSAGTGKTTFGLQFLDHALAQGDNAVFITLEESRERVINSATEKGFPFDEYVDEGRLAIVDLDPIEMANSLSSIRSELPALVEQFGAARLVLDSVSLLEMMYEDQATRRNEIYDFTTSLKEAGVTALLTSEAASETPYASRYGIVEYLTDAVFILQYVRAADDFRETQLAIEIQKIRDANHSRHKKPYEITGEGISVYQQANLF